MDRPRTALIADDHRIVAEGLRTLLREWGWDVVAVASDGAEAVRLAEQHRPDIALLDVAMPKLDGLKAARRIVRCSPGTAVVVLTALMDRDVARASTHRGVAAALSKTRVATELADVLDRVYVQARGTTRSRNGDSLTPRQQALVRLVAQGRSTKEAAAALGVAVKTAETHRTQAMRRLGVHDTAGLVRYAVRKGLIRP